MKLSKISSLAERGVHSLTKAGRWVSVAVLFFMMLLVAADVIGRYVFNNPITGAIEINELMMIFLVFLALAYCTLEKGHIRVELLASHLPKRTQAILDSFTSLLSIGIVALITWQMALWGGRELVSLLGRRTLLLAIPEAPFILITAVSSGLLCFELLIDFFHSVAEVSGKRVDK